MKLLYIHWFYEGLWAAKTKNDSVICIFFKKWVIMGHFDLLGCNGIIMEKQHKKWIHIPENPHKKLLHDHLWY